MGTLSFDVVDVFAPAPFAGNPLAVVHGGAGLSGARMQALAREFNLSETVFPLAPTQPGADYRARIFTPSSELPFAGHPSVGVAWVLARDGVIGLGDVVQECGAGLLPVTVSVDGAAVSGGAPSLGAELDAASLAALVGLTADDVADPRARVCGAGVDWAFLAVRPDAVARAQVPVAAEVARHTGVTGLTVVSVAAAAPAAAADPAADPVAADPAADPVAVDAVAVDAVAVDPVAGAAADSGAGAVAGFRAHLRFFAPGEGVPEDPATGSAAVGLGVWLVSLGLLPGDGVSEVVIDQGAEMGRPSRLELRVQAAGGAAVTTRVGGRVVPISSGTIAVPPA